MQTVDVNVLVARTTALERRGIKGVDAAHLAAALLLSADAFVTTDDRLLARAKRLGLGVRAVGPIELAMEIVR
jgi:predicted nucleic acid-binding protein